eukprot:4869080-Pyramimonas_sp.AAC.1
MGRAGQIGPLSIRPASVRCLRTAFGTRLGNASTVLRLTRRAPCVVAARARSPLGSLAIVRP